MTDPIFDHDRPDVCRLALVITELEVGGAERCLVRLACGLDRSEFACRVYSLAPTPCGSHALVEELESAGIPIHFLGGTSVWRTFGVWRRLRGLWKAEPPDVVQSFLFHANIVSGMACPAQTPLSLGVRVADPRAGRLWLEKRVAGRTRPVICVSEAVARQLSSQGYASEQLRVIPNGIEPQAYRGLLPADLTRDGLAEGRRLLLVIGRLDRQKGLDWLLQLAPELLRTHPEHDLAIAGGGPEAAWLGERIQSLGLESRIRLLGWRADVPSLLARCEILLLTSRYEGMPNVILEAMASARPVVATRVEGVEELLGSGSEPQTALFGDSPAFLAKVRALTTSAELRKHWGENNLRRVSQKFSVSVMVDRYAAHFRNLMGSCRKGKKSG